MLLKSYLESIISVFLPYRVLDINLVTFSSTNRKFQKPAKSNGLTQRDTPTKASEAATTP
jgi:hypothetical protein